jgi:hypothetical protein
MTQSHVLLISPVSQLPTVISTNSHSYPELMQVGYQAIQFGTKKELTEIEIEMIAEFAGQLD